MAVSDSSGPRIHISPKLKGLLQKIPQFSLSFISGPMGYGKSTAARQLFRAGGWNVLWQSVSDLGAPQFWLDFSAQFKNIDPSLSQGLSSLGLPDNPLSLHQTLSLISGLKLDQETFLVIDDYHLVDHGDLHHFLVSLAMRKVPRFHVVITSRNEGFDGLTELVLKGAALQIGRQDLTFGIDDVQSYFASAGFPLSPQRAEELQSLTEGWISALYLCLAGLESDPSFVSTQAVHEIREGTLMNLVDSAVFRHLSPEAQELLLRLSPFDSFSVNQAEFLFPSGSAASTIQDLLGHNAFIVPEKNRGQFRMHHILTGFLRQAVQNRPRSFREEVYRRAADWYFETKLYWQAMDLYFQAGAYERFLETLELDKANSISAEQKSALIPYMEALPEEIKRRYPRALLIYARRLFTYNERERFSQLTAAFLDFLKTAENLGDQEKNELQGELELILSFTGYNDIEKMSFHHRRACELLKQPTRILDLGGSWTFGSPSILYLFHREVGRLEAETQIIREAMPFYYTLSRDHGKGAEHVMAAERFFQMGQFADAEIEVHKALNISLDHFSSGIAVCALFLQVRLAFIKGDFPQMVALFARLREDLNQNRQFLFLHTLDVCEAFVFSSLGALERIPSWISQGDFRNVRLLFPAMGYLNIVWGRVLLAQKEFLKLIGLCDHFQRIASVFPNVMGQLVAHLHRAAALESVHRREEALVSLIRALEMGEPDRLIMPFVEITPFLGPLYRDLAGTARWGAFLKPVNDLALGYQKAAQEMTETYLPAAPLALTRREREVATLAAQDFTNSQVAEQLEISQNTVKTLLRLTFEKLGIRSRSQLKDALKNLS